MDNKQQNKSFLGVTSLWAKLTDSIGDQRDSLLLWIPVFLGIGAAIYFGIKTEPQWGIVGGLLTASIGGWGYIFQKFRHALDPSQWFLPFVLCSALLWTSIGFASAKFRSFIVETPVLMTETRPVTLDGVISYKEAQEHGGGWLIVLDQVQIKGWPQEKTPHHIRLTIRTKLDGDVGDRVSVLAKLHPPSPPNLPGGFDFQRFYYFSEIGAVGFSLGNVTVLDSQRSGKDGYFLERLRSQISHEIIQTLDPSVAGIASALMTGERAAISDDDWRDLRYSGLAHIISISGLHVAMVATPIFFLVRLFLATIPYIALRYPIKKFAAMAALLACLLYVGLVVPSVPTYRSMLMTGVGLIAIMLDRSPFSMRMVAFAGAVVLLIYPESIWSASFQMSFAAVIALIAVADWMRPYWMAWNRDSGVLRRVILYLAGSILTTCVASIATAPFSAYHFQQIAVYSVIANALAIPLSGLIIMPMLILAFLAMPFGLASLPLHLMGTGIEWMLVIAREVSRIPGSVWHVSGFPFSSLLAVSLAGIILCLSSGRMRWLSVAPLTIALWAAVIYAPPQIIISQNGDLILVHDGEEAYISSRKTGRYEAQAWLKVLGFPPDYTPQLFPKEGILPLSNGSISCDSEACRIETEGIRVLTGRSAYALAQDCSWADLVVTPDYVRLKQCPDGSPPRAFYNHWRLATTGAISIAGGNVQTVNGERGRRPWNSDSKNLMVRPHQ